MKKKNCRHCQKVFYTECHCTEYCSSACRCEIQRLRRNESYKINKVVKNKLTCEYCLREFETNKKNARFCSPGCRELYENQARIQNWINATPRDHKKISRIFRKNRITLEWSQRRKYAST